MGKLQCVAEGTRTLLGAVILVSVLPVVVPLLLVLWVWRCLALLVVLIRHRKIVHMASGLEALFALDSAGARAVISGVLVVRGRVEIATVRARLLEHVLDVRSSNGRLLHPKFRQMVEKRCGVVVWMWEDDFQINSHVREAQRELRDEVDLLEEIVSRNNLPFVRGHSCWEMLVAPLASYGNQQEPHTAVLVRLHHSLGDGRSFITLLLSALLDRPLDKPQFTPLARHHHEGRLARFGSLLWAVSNTPWVMRRVLRRGEPSPLHGCRLEGRKLLAWSSPMSLAVLKEGRTLAGVTVNDLLLAGLGQALHRHLKMVGDEVPQRVVTVLPVDVTAPNVPLAVANNLSLCTFSLPTGSMTPLTRLKAIHRRLEKLKESPDILVNYLVLDMFTNLLPTPLARRALNTHGVTLVASNLPGPQETIHMFGGAVDDVMFWIPNKSRTGIGVSMLSYRGWVRLGINVDTALVNSEEAAQRLVEDTIIQTKLLLTGLGATEAEPATLLSDIVPNASETELLLGEETQIPLRPGQPPRVRPAIITQKN